jgi:hypothetical protein
MRETNKVKGGVINKFNRVVFTTRLSARSVAEPHVTHTTPVDIRECPRPSLQPSRGQIRMSLPLLIESLMRAYYWPIGLAVRPYIYLMR